MSVRGKDEEYEERAAIIEFCGNVPRAEAELLAMKQIREAKLKKIEADALRDLGARLALKLRSMA